MFGLAMVFRSTLKTHFLTSSTIAKRQIDYRSNCSVAFCFRSTFKTHSVEKCYHFGATMQLLCCIFGWVMVCVASHSWFSGKCYYTRASIWLPGWVLCVALVFAALSVFSPRRAVSFWGANVSFVSQVWFYYGFSDIHKAHSLESANVIFLLNVWFW